MLIRPMSALPPKTDMCSATGDVRFVPKADSCAATITRLFDHLLGAAKEWQRNGEPERFGSLQIDN